MSEQQQPAGRISDFEAQWPAFTVTCNACDSPRVRLDNTLDSHPESGAWGDVALVCTRCGVRNTIAACP